MSRCPARKSLDWWTDDCESLIKIEHLSRWNHVQFPSPSVSLGSRWFTSACYCGAIRLGKARHTDWQGVLWPVFWHFMLRGKIASCFFSFAPLRMSQFNLVIPVREIILFVLWMFLLCEVHKHTIYTPFPAISFKVCKCKF